MMRLEHVNIELELLAAKHILTVMPHQHWFKSFEIRAADTSSDIGVYDLLLHKRDVSYSINDISTWLENCGIHFIDLGYFSDRSLLNIKNQITDYNLYNKMKRSNDRTQQYICEIISSFIIKHDFYASRRLQSESKLSDLNNNLYVYGD